MAVLSKLVISTAGILPHDTAHIKRWIEANGGTYAPIPNKSTTHLLASKDAYKKPHAAVQHASDLGIWIVSFDWFDDSLQAKRKLSEKKYTWDSLRRAKKKSREIKRLGVLSDGKKFRDGCEAARRLTGSGMLKGSSGSGSGSGGGSRGKESSRGRKETTKKKSTSFFFGEESVVGLDTPFVSAKEDLERRRRDRQVRTGTGTSIQTSVLSSTSSASSLPPTTTTTTTTTTTLCPPTLPTQAKLSWKDLYHYYLDVTGFEYKITLLRSEPDTNSFARYTVGLLETHAKPHTYCVNVQYTPPATRTHNAVALKTAAPPAPAPAPAPTSPALSEPSRLTLLTHPPLPSPSAPYQSLITPHHTHFPTAFRAFRHLFHDLTLLPWESRFAPSFKAAQAARAAALAIEPYAYKKPAPGLPLGLTMQLAESALPGPVFDDPSYTRNVFGLPGLDAPLSERGVVGARVRREGALVAAEMGRREK